MNVVVNFGEAFKANAMAHGWSFDSDGYIRKVNVGMEPAMAAKTVKQFLDTEAKKAFIVNANSRGYTFADSDDRPERVIQGFFLSVAAFLSKNKEAKTDQATALVLTDVGGTFMFGALVEYHENEANADEPGNYSLIFTFDESDIEEVEQQKTVKRYLFSSPEFRALFAKISYDIACVEFGHDSFMYEACLLIVDTITQVLDHEAVENDVVDIVYEKYFIASVAVENGEKVFGIVPDGYMKEIIKDDSSLEI